MSVVYLNGEFLDADEAVVSVLDRGFLFGDGVYEVIPCYAGRLFRLDAHLKRLENSLQETRIRVDLTRDIWAELLGTLVQKNGSGNLSVYLQITRGVAAERDHGFAADLAPTIFAMATPMKPAMAADLENARGVAAVTREDTRWARCDIKSIQLLPNILLRQSALDAGAQEAILVRDGLALEGAASNLFAVIQGVLITPPKGPQILGGITRDLILELAAEHGIEHAERPVPLEDLREAEEIWVTSSTRELVPVVQLDDMAVGMGVPGPAWQRMARLYQSYKRALEEGARPG